MPELFLTGLFLLLTDQSAMHAESMLFVPHSAKRGRSVADVWHCQAVIPTLKILTTVYDEQDDTARMITPAQIALQLIDWTDPQKAV